MNSLVKICGITNFADALFCATAGANYLGFIFYEKSPRYIHPSKAREIIRNLPSSALPVGVFVNEKRETIERTIRETNIKIIQLSGDESPDDCSDFSVEVWKAFRLTKHDEVNQSKEYKISAALLDGSNNGMYGGTGTHADYSIAQELKKIHRLVFAGGLNPENICEAIHAVQPFAVDVNSGVELVPRKKDHHKIKLLFDNLSKFGKEE
ncbi:MAG: phosphoribosylanthranilate isomerase [Ignavibacteriae bacterium]|nr:phosphoribosylanthranilate isomerase [Ignavibacteriota bacterium]